MTETCETVAQRRCNHKKLLAVKLVSQFVACMQARDDDGTIQVTLETFMQAMDGLKRERTGTLRGLRFPIAVQEVCYTYWTLGRENPTVRFGVKHKVGYGQVYDYFKNDLAAFGITSARLFRRALGARIDRVSRSGYGG